MHQRILPHNNYHRWTQIYHYLISFPFQSCLYNEILYLKKFLHLILGKLSWPNNLHICNFKLDFRIFRHHVFGHFSILHRRNSHQLRQIFHDLVFSLNTNNLRKLLQIGKLVYQHHHKGKASCIIWILCMYLDLI